ncbi:MULTISPECIES: hypothetical protein [Okeania]|nr:MULTISPECIES: hypothetical protein [Okeania]
MNPNPIEVGDTAFRHAPRTPSLLLPPFVARACQIYSVGNTID